MARPWRRVIVGLAIRIGIPYTEVERWDMEAIREHLVVLAEINKPAGAAPRAVLQTPQEVERGLVAAFGKPKVKD